MRASRRRSHHSSPLAPGVKRPRSAKPALSSAAMAVAISAASKPSGAARISAVTGPRPSSRLRRISTRATSAVQAVAAWAGGAATAWTAEVALVEILRSRLEGLGPVTAEILAAPLGFEAAEIATAIAALESAGFALRGRFTPGANGDEWCERRLLARIHTYTVKRLRAEIEPVAARDFLRFLFAWQRVTAEARMQGPDAVEVVAAQLEGFEAPAGAWESEILPARIAEYEPNWLDDQCLAGRIAWARLRPRDPKSGGGERGATPVRTTPITLLARRHVALWTSLSPLGEAGAPSPRAQAVADFIRAHGASFFDEMVEGTGLLRTQLEEALAELVALGLVSSDSFGGLRALLVPSP